MVDAPDQTSLPIFPAPQPLSAAEVTAALEAGIRCGAAGSLSRAADVFLATVCAHVLAERLHQAGLVVCRASPDDPAAHHDSPGLR